MQYNNLNSINSWNYRSREWVFKFPISVKKFDYPSFLTS